MFGAVGQIVLAGRGLADRLAFAGHQRLIELELVGADDAAVGGDFVAHFQQNEIADHHILQSDGCTDPFRWTLTVTESLAAFSFSNSLSLRYSLRKATPVARITATMTARPS